jgi:ubiquinone/menaquinone biosynthesis C-methylase UbiE
VTTTDKQHWESQANNWIEWARTPGFDAYWYYRARFFEILPPPDGLALDVGCGEGRLARDLAARGYDVTGIEPAPTLLQAAKKAHPEGTYIQAEASDLPFSAESVQLLLSYNSLMDTDDLDGAMREFARVLKPSGRLCITITHPVADSMGFAIRDAEAPFVIEGSYLRTAPFSGWAERQGIKMHFSGWHRSIATYSKALQDAGLLIEAIREPMPQDEAPARDWDRWRRMPMFMHIRALKR